jgi:hypothetical protein
VGGTEFIIGFEGSQASSMRKEAIEWDLLHDGRERELLVTVTDKHDDRDAVT